jgi:hypothetical protein
MCRLKKAHPLPDLTIPKNSSRSTGLPHGCHARWLVLQRF